MRHKKLKFKKGFRVAFSNKKAQVAEMVLPPGEEEGGADNKHIGSDQWLFVQDGRGVATVNGRRYVLGTGSILLIEKGDVHEIRNTGKKLLRTLNWYVPPAFKKNGDPLPAGKKK